MINTLNKREVAEHKLPLAIEVLDFLRANIRRSESKVAYKIVRRCILLRFSFFLRGGASPQLRNKDVAIAENRVGQFASAFLQRPKTDVREKGGSRSLCKTTTNLFAASTVELLMRLQKVRDRNRPDLGPHPPAHPPEISFMRYVRPPNGRNLAVAWNLVGSLPTQCILADRHL